MSPPVASVVFGWRLTGAHLSTVIDREDRQGLGVSGFDAVHNNVLRSRDNKLARSGKGAFVSSVWIVSEKLTYLTDTQCNAATRSGTFCSDVGGDRVEMARSACGLAQPHHSKRRQNASISSSVANSPRSASAIASFRSSICSGV